MPSRSKRPSQNPSSANPHQLSLLCRQHRSSPSATLDLLILLLVLFSSLFLLSSFLSSLLSALSPSLLLLLLVLLLLAVAASSRRSRRCRNPNCRGLKKVAEFDVQLQTEDCLKLPDSKREIDDLPWKGGAQGNPDYTCLVSELRRLAPANGRAVLLFLARCGCAVAKLEAWGPKRGRRHKKNTGTLAIGNGDRG